MLMSMGTKPRLGKFASFSSTTITMTRGAFIVIEGLDRSGKSTQIANLAARLVRGGKQVEVTKFPGQSS
jgi:adenylylsulfate kinase-like enzyme